MSRRRTLLGAVGLISLATAISRILGLVREQVLAAFFTTYETDAYFVAFRIPNLLRDLFAEGALSAAFIPTFTDYLRNRGPNEAWRLANLVINALLVVLSLVTLAMVLGADYLVYALGAGFSRQPGKLALTAELARIMSPFLLFVALAAAVMGMLNVHGHFFLPALAPAVFNVVNILAGVFLSPLMPKIGQEPIVAMAVGSLLGGAGQLLIQLPKARRVGLYYRPALGLKDPGLERIRVLMLPAIFGLSITQINILVDNQLASWLGNGPVSWLNYAFRLMHLPIGLFGIAIATVNLAAVSREAAAGDYRELRNTLARSIRLTAFLTIPAAAGLIALRYPIIRVIYEHGRFTSADTASTADAMLFYAIGLFAYSAVKVIVPTFYALGDTRAPVLAGAAAVLAKIAVNLLLIWHLGHLGLALGTALAATLNYGLLAHILSRRLGPAEVPVIPSAIKISIASLIMALSCHYLYRGLEQRIAPNALSAEIVVLGACIAFGITVFFAASLLLRVEEASGFWSQGPAKIIGGFKANARRLGRRISQLSQGGKGGL